MFKTKVSDHLISTERTIGERDDSLALLTYGVQIFIELAGYSICSSSTSLFTNFFYHGLRLFKFLGERRIGWPPLTRGQQSERASSEDNTGHNIAKDH